MIILVYTNLQSDQTFPNTSPSLVNTYFTLASHQMIEQC